MSSSPTAFSLSSDTASGGRRWHVRLAIVHGLFAVIPSNALNRTRLLALKACGIRMGTDTLFWGMPRLTGPGPIASRLRIGAQCGFNDGCEFDLSAPITLADNVSVGHEVRFLTSRRPAGAGHAVPITVGEGVWIGARCTLLGGVTVGAGAVIGAGVTVATDVPANTLVMGEKHIPLPTWQR
jgi:acetyltransferase-like isoleucine patch superfamily enzyme